MKSLRRMIYRFRAVLSRRSDDQDLAAELECHIQLQTEDNLRAGMTPEAARREAILKFGGIDSVKAGYREQRSLPLLESLLLGELLAVLFAHSSSNLSAALLSGAVAAVVSAALCRRRRGRLRSSGRSGRSVRQA